MDQSNRQGQNFSEVVPAEKRKETKMSEESKFNIPRIICDLQRKSWAAIHPANRVLFAAAADLICEFRDRMAIAERERKEMAEALKKEHGCTYCTHWCPSSANPSHHPCGKCKEVFGIPNWKWKGGAKL